MNVRKFPQIFSVPLLATAFSVRQLSVRIFVATPKNAIEITIITDPVSGTECASQDLRASGMSSGANLDRGKNNRNAGRSWSCPG